MSIEQDPASRLEALRTAEELSSLHSLYILYHELRPEKSSYTYALDCEHFKTQVKLFAELRRTGNPLGPEITFDDGHISNYEFALPILETQKLHAQFFITVGWTGRKAGYMAWEELRSMHKAGHLIGAHGWSHTLLTHCTKKELDLELKQARLALEDGLGIPITTMSLPGGRFNRHVLDACSAAGYTQIFTSVPRAERRPPGALVGRLNIRGDVSLAWLTRLFTPGDATLKNLERQERVKATARAALGDRMYSRIWALLNRQSLEQSRNEASS
ncbi:MAG: polysaccharide deacetylase family protein [Acidobacteriota bacterium]|nr:polysaccharide deacetylase family protein [Acidobacteriota bacterium]